MITSIPGRALRIVLIAAFVILTLPVFPMIGFSIKSMAWLIRVDLFVRAIPLYIAWWVDSTWYDAGELSPGFMPLWVALTAVMLWPMATGGVYSRVWESPVFRRIVYGYSCVVVAGTLAAASWIFSHTGVFF